jgi:hypothetical protein
VITSEQIEIAKSFREGHEILGGATPRLDPNNPDREGALGLAAEDWVVQNTGWPRPNREFMASGDGGSDWILRKKGTEVIYRFNVLCSDVTKYGTSWRNRLHLQVKLHNVSRADVFGSIVRIDNVFQWAGFATRDEMTKSRMRPSTRLLTASGEPVINYEKPYTELNPLDFLKLKEYEVATE